MQTTEQNYFYALKKVLYEFKKSDQTRSFDVLERSLDFIENEISFNDDDTIFYEVASLLAIGRDYPLDQITPQTSLKEDLLMSQNNKQFLRVPFNSIIKRNGSSRWVTNGDCVSCKTVNDCVELIKSKL